MKDNVIFKLKKNIKKNKILRYMYHIPRDLGNYVIDNIVINTYKKKNINSAKEIQKLYNIHGGERCFIIGNGPSLMNEDLEKLKNEITFASNRIYEIYNQTKWRPTYYCSADPNVAKTIKKNIIDVVNSSSMIFLNLRYINDYDREITEDNKVYFYYVPIALGINHIKNENKQVLPKFSNDFSKKTYSSATITYEMIQLAIYMGFREIYLIGVDHQYKLYSENGILKEDSTVKTNYFHGLAEADADGCIPAPVFNPRTTLGYEGAKRYAEKNGIIIKNATRGGKLEVFERIDLDVILSIN